MTTEAQKRMIFSLFVLSFLFMSDMAFSIAPEAQERYELHDWTIMNGVKSHTGSLPDESLTILGLMLDKSTFEDVRKYLGPASNLPRTNDPHEADIICYVAENSSPIHLAFTAGWPENPTVTLTSFTLFYDKLLPLTGPCTPSMKLPPNVKTGNGLSLGLTQSQLASILGTPSKVTRTWLVYSFEKYREYSKVERAKKPRAPGGGEYKGEYKYQTLAAHFTKDKLDLLRVSVGGEPDW
jgi:hypothetical protein